MNMWGRELTAFEVWRQARAKTGTPQEKQSRTLESEIAEFRRQQKESL